MRPDIDPPIAWDWLGVQPVVAATEHVLHVRLQAPLRIAVDGRTGSGVIQRADREATQ